MVLSETSEERNTTEDSWTSSLHDTPTTKENTMENINSENAFTFLRGIRIKNVDNVIIASLNINSLGNKIDALKEVIGNNIDILIIVETKIDSSFPDEQFF